MSILEVKPTETVSPFPVSLTNFAHVDNSDEIEEINRVIAEKQAELLKLAKVGKTKWTHRVNPRTASKVDGIWW